MPSLLNTVSFIPIPGSSKSRDHDSTKKDNCLNCKSVFKSSMHNFYMLHPNERYWVGTAENFQSNQNKASFDLMT